MWRRCGVSYVIKLILAYKWARLAILVAGKGREGCFLFLLFLHFHSFSSFFPVPLLSPLLSLLFSPFLRSQNDPQGHESTLKGHESTLRSGFEVIKLFSCSTQLSMKFVLLINLNLLTNANSFLLNIAGHENFSANKYMKMPTLLAFSYLLAEKISCSAELSRKNVL